MDSRRFWLAVGALLTRCSLSFFFFLLTNLRFYLILGHRVSREPELMKTAWKATAKTFLWESTSPTRRATILTQVDKPHESEPPKCKF